MSPFLSPLLTRDRGQYFLYDEEYMAPARALLYLARQHTNSSCGRRCPMRADGCLIEFLADMCPGFQPRSLAYQSRQYYCKSWSCRCAASFDKAASSYLTKFCPALVALYLRKPSFTRTSTPMRTDVSRDSR